MEKEFLKPVQMIFIRDQKKRQKFEKEALCHLDSLYYAALKLAGHQQDAEDLVQETYSKAFSHLNQLRDLLKIKPWLYQIMINTWKNWRSKRSKEVVLDHTEEWEDWLIQNAQINPQSHLMNPEKEIIDRELCETVESALMHLPSHYRVVVFLSDIEGFSYKEISEIIGRPIGTVMSRLSRARSHLSHMLKRYKERA